MILALGTTPTVQRTMTFAKLTLDVVNRAIDVRGTVHYTGPQRGYTQVADALGKLTSSDEFVTQPVEFGTIAETVSASAALQPRDAVPVGTELAGRVVQVFADLHQTHIGLRRRYTQGARADADAPGARCDDTAAAG